MTCKAGSKLLRKVAVPTVAAITLMLCTTQSARPQSFHGQQDATIYSGANLNVYSCEINALSTPQKAGTWPVAKTNWSCTATLTDGTPVTSAVKSEGQASFEITIPGFGQITIFFPVDITERPDGTANVKSHI